MTAALAGALAAAISARPSRLGPALSAEAVVSAIDAAVIAEGERWTSCDRTAPAGSILKLNSEKAMAARRLPDSSYMKKMEAIRYDPVSRVSTHSVLNKAVFVSQGGAGEAAQLDPQIRQAS